VCAFVYAMAHSVQGFGVVVREHNKISIEKLTFKAPLPGQVRVKIHACGLCHSDVSGLTGKIPFPLPCALGHEGAGVIESVGSSESKWKVGDRVILTLVMPCGT